MGSRAWGILPAWGWGTAQEAAELAALDDLPSSSRQPCPSAQVTASTGECACVGGGHTFQEKARASLAVLLWGSWEPSLTSEF